MPTYSYRCTECGNAFDIVQAFTDDSLTECPSCRGRLRKLFSAVGVTFNGSGFYRTDSRSQSRSSVGAGSSAKGKSDGAGGGATTAGSGASSSSGSSSSSSSAGSTGSASGA